MNSLNATITSKNQLTLPAKLVRKYKMDQNRSVTIIDKNGVIEIRPQPSLEERMEKLWDQFHRSHPSFPKLADDDIHTEARQAYKAHFKD